MYTGSNWLRLFSAFLPLLLPGIMTGFTGLDEKDFLDSLKPPLFSLLFFLTPIVFFYRNIRVYFYLLVPLIAVMPLIVLSILSGVAPGYKMIALLLQTNPREAVEALEQYLLVLVPAEFGIVLSYFICVQGIRNPRIPLKHAALASGISFLLLASLAAHENKVTPANFSSFGAGQILLVPHYPFSIVDGIQKAMAVLEQNDINRIASFSFGAHKLDSLNGREVYVMIIGESARYDRWQINGYSRNTSPRLALRDGVITFRNAVAGAHFTRLSIPQLITRATPDNFSRQFNEKSILTAFSEAGFTTLWLSNHSDNEILTLGTVLMHAKSADKAVFSPTFSPMMELDEVYDERLLPILDSALNSEKDLFVVLHTMGSHWDYGKRYPKRFDRFKPSSKSSDNPASREAIINAYDNSILYSDYFIDRVIAMIHDRSDVSGLLYVADHGEDLFEVFSDRLNFHFRPSASTLRVPLFIWTSDRFDQEYPNIVETLKRNVDQKIGAENVFYTMLDLAHIRFQDFDSTKSIASPFFVPSAQRFYDDENQCARSFGEVCGPEHDGPTHEPVVMAGTSVRK